MTEFNRFIELKPDRFMSVRRFAESSDTEREYYCAILDGRQRGRVFCDDPTRPGMVLFWHYAGYGFAAGEPDDAFMRQVTAMILQEHPCFCSDTYLQKRFILQQDDPSGSGILAHMPGIARSERLCFILNGSGSNVPSLPVGYHMQTADASALARMQGGVTPSFSWSSDAEFLRAGVACCVLHGTEIAAWAFSSAIGGGRMDIGVETAPLYRGKGLATAAACAMVNVACRMGLTPAWGCDISNVASAHTARRAGFVLWKQHGKYKKSQ